VLEDFLNSNKEFLAVHADDNEPAPAGDGAHDGPVEQARALATQGLGDRVNNVGHGDDHSFSSCDD
jgi:hypothetical protein